MKRVCRMYRTLQQVRKHNNDRKCGYSKLQQMREHNNDRKCGYRTLQQVSEHNNDQKCGYQLALPQVRNGVPTPNAVTDVRRSRQRQRTDSQTNKPPREHPGAVRIYYGPATSVTALWMVSNSSSRFSSSMQEKATRRSVSPRAIVPIP